MCAIEFRFLLQCRMCVRWCSRFDSIRDCVMMKKRGRGEQKREVIKRAREHPKQEMSNGSLTSQPFVEWYFHIFLHNSFIFSYCVCIRCNVIMTMLLLSVSDWVARQNDSTPRIAFLCNRYSRLKYLCESLQDCKIV